MYPFYIPPTPYDDADFAPYHPKIAIEDRKCKKCSNKSLRSVVMPDTGYPIALCRLCGCEHDL